MISNDDKKVNEAGGRLFEFITQGVLQGLFPSFTIEWQPKGIASVVIQPDIAIYDSQKQLRAIGFCAHATAVNAAGMKVERSIEELFEIKESHHDVLALSFIWHSPNGWVLGQLRTMDMAFDYSFVAYRDCKSIWDKIFKMMLRLSSEVAGKKDEECVKVVSKSGLIKKLLPYFEPLKRLMSTGRERNHDLWELARGMYSRWRRSEKSITINQPIKDGLIPLIWVPEAKINEVLSHGNITYSEDLEAFIRLGGGRRILSGAMIRRSASVACVSMYNDRSIVINAIKSLKSAEGISSLINSMGSATALQRRIDRIIQAVNDNSLGRLCREAENEEDIDYTGTSWVLVICTEWIKRKVDKKFGLFEAQRESLGDKGSRFKTEFVVISYIDGDFKAFSDEELNALCDYISSRLKDVTPITVAEISRSLKTESSKKKKHNPLHWLVEETLRHYGVTFLKSYRMFSVFSDPHSQGNSGGTTFQQLVKTNMRNYIIHALSTYSSTHKDVEFAAKSRLLHYTISKGRFRQRKGYEFIYVLDGVWPKRTVEMLSRAGAIVVPIIAFPEFVARLATEIYYPVRETYEDEEMREAAEGTKGYGKKKV